MTTIKDEEQWFKLCELVAHESDPQRLSKLVDQLLKELDTRRQALRKQQPQPANGDK